RAFIALPAQVARGSFELPWRMGEAYMALGRLDVAIGYLRRAAELQGLLTMTYRRPGAEILVLYALAAAYDRDEQLDAARTIMEKVVPWEGNAMTTLSRPDLRVAPPEDVYYYKAMLKESPTRAGDRVVPAQAPEQSLVLYRQFAKLHGGGPWARRARAHIDALRRDPLSARGVKPGGSATFDTAAAAVQIARVDEQLQRCVKDVPTALFDVSITANAAGRGTRRNEPVMVLGTGPSPLGPGVTAKAYLDFTGAPEAIAAAGQCLEDVARGIKLPPPAGPPGTWGQVTFPVAWQGQ
ncbi:MAG TPA: tetratricopeptide repeat protein, partial [Kofleriaceae bacterium]|nr:tetratricopeptide repeat protein [Kofleriaceae bacterium]